MHPSPVASCFSFYKMEWEGRLEVIYVQTLLDFHNPLIFKNFSFIPNLPVIFNNSDLRSLCKTFAFILETNLFLFICIFNVHNIQISKSVYIFILMYVFYWSIVDLQCFGCTAGWLSYTYTHILSLKLFSIMGNHEILTTVPCAIQSIFVACCVIYFLKIRNLAFYSYKSKKWNQNAINCYNDNQNVINFS